MGEQKVRALLNVQKFLRNKDASSAVALVRMGREIWTDEPLFGNMTQSPEEEFGVIRNLLVSELQGATEEVFGGEEEEEELHEEEIEEEETRIEQSTDREFNLKHFLSTMVSPKILIPYAHLLQFYKLNEPSTNHAIVKMMHRVAVDLKIPEMI